MTELVPKTAVDSDDEEFVDETLAERLWGLTEMFPERLRNATSTVTNFTWNGSKLCLSYSRSALWMITSTFTVLMLPVLFEKERAAMQEHQVQQQRQMLMGPNAAASGGAGMPHMMSMMPPNPGPQS